MNKVNHHLKNLHVLPAFLIKSAICRSPSSFAFCAPSNAQNSIGNNFIRFDLEEPTLTSGKRGNCMGLKKQFQNIETINLKFMKHINLYFYFDVPFKVHDLSDF